MKTLNTPLADWLRAASPDEQARMALLAGTSVNYLYQLAGCHRGAPKSNLAFAIEDATIKMHAATDGRLPVITARQLSIMCVVADFAET